MKKILSLLSLSFLILPALVSAATFNGNDIVSITSPVNDDFYGAGNEVNIDSAVTGDVVTAGRGIDISGEVTGDVTAAGETITISSPVKDDIRAAGRRIRINTTVGDDVFAAGEVIELSDSTVNGDVYAGGQTIIISGTINGTVRAAGEKVEIKPGTHITGDLLTYGNKEPVIGQDVTIDGSRKHRKEEVKPQQRQSVLLNWLKGVVTCFILGSILLYIFPRFTARVIATSKGSMGRSILTGAVWSLLFIPASIMLLISGIAFPIGLAIILLTLALYVLASGYTVILIGSWVLQRLNKTVTPLSWQHVLLGAVLYKSIMFIPGVGPTIILLLTLLMFGSMLVTLWHYEKPTTSVGVA